MSIIISEKREFEISNTRVGRFQRNQNKINLQSTNQTITMILSQRLLFTISIAAVAQQATIAPPRVGKKGKAVSIRTFPPMPLPILGFDRTIPSSATLLTSGMIATPPRPAGSPPPPASLLHRQEREFLDSRKAWSSEEPSAFRQRQHRQSEKLHQFRSSLRRLVREWGDRLDRLDMPSPEDDGGGGDGGNSDPCRELENLKEELRLLQQHVLTGGRMTTPSSLAAAALPDAGSADRGAGGWPAVPEDFPHTDLRLLHAELSRCSARWEEVSARILPVRTFRFTRYREEAARRAAEERTQEATPANGPSSGFSFSSRCPADEGGTGVNSNDGSTGQRSEGSVATVSEACLQNFSDVIITIDSMGSVTVEGQRDGDCNPCDGPITRMGHQVTVGAALLIRNLENCRVIM